MTEASGSTRGAALAAVVLAAAGLCRAQATWWNYRWPYRRGVTVPDAPKTVLDGDEIGVATMPTGGLTRGDGGDVRVVTDRGEVVPHRVLMVGPGDRIRVAFALKWPAKRYYAYFGNAEAPKPTRELVVRRGVLLETWAGPGPVPRALPQARQLAGRVSALIGRDFVGRVFQGHNPFGPQDRLFSVFTGYLTCRDGGEYEFSTSSQDASFLLVDGELVVANGGRHPPQRRAVRRGTVQLRPGLHQLKVYHVSGGGDPVIVAAWRPPGAKRPVAIPAEAFAPVRRAQVEMLEQYGTAYQADFLPAHAGEAFMANHYLQRYTFEAQVRGRFVSPPKFRWDFGDGQTADMAKVDHVYLADGPVKVTLTATVGGRAITRANTIYVTRPWDQVTRSRLDPLADHAGIVSGYDFTRTPSDQLASAITLLHRANMPKAILRAGDALVKRDAAPAAALETAVPIYADALVADGQAARAVASLLKGSEMTKDPAVAAALTSGAGQKALAAGDTDGAERIFRQCLKRHSAMTTHAAIREARIGLGDVWRARGDYDQARAAYESARPLGQAGYEKQAVRKGDLARHAEDYIRRRLYADAEEALDRWEYDFPTEKLEGLSTLLRVRLELARRRPAAAAEQAERLVRVNPRSNYAPELLHLAAEAYRRLGRGDQARRTLRRIVDHYPESPLAAEVAKKLSAKP